MRYGANLLSGGCWSSLYCMPASLAVSCSSMQCRNSNLMLGNVTAQQSSAGCNVTSCSYGGYVNGTIMTTYATLLTCANSSVVSQAYSLRSVVAS